MIRSYVKDQAREQAEETARDFAQPAARRAALDWLEEKAGQNSDINALMLALGEEGGENETQQ